MIFACLVIVKLMQQRTQRKSMNYMALFHELVVFASGKAD